jgi:hypothetical protein
MSVVLILGAGSRVGKVCGFIVPLILANRLIIATATATATPD